MDKLDLRYYLYHAIEPIDYSKEDSLYERLELFLKTGYIFKGVELAEKLPLEYRNKVLGCDSYVYFALTVDNMLPKNITNPYGEDSAFMYHIESNLAFMFDDTVIRKFEIINLPGWICYEVVITSSVPLTMAKALYYPEKNILDLIELYKTNTNDEYMLSEDSYLREAFEKKNEKIKEKLSLVLENPEKYMDDFYKKVDRIKEILNAFGYNIPIVSPSGYILDKKEETKFINDNYDEVKLLIKI